MKTTTTKPIAVDKIFKIIDAEARLIEGELSTDLCDWQSLEEDKCNNVGRCVIGALLFAAGHSDEELRKNPGNELRNGTKFAKTLFKEYGLIPAFTGAMEKVNDDTPEGRGWDEFAERRKEVKDLVLFAELMRQNGVVYKSKTRHTMWGPERLLAFEQLLRDYRELEYDEDEDLF